MACQKLANARKTKQQKEVEKAAREAAQGDDAPKKSVKQKDNPPTRRSKRLAPGTSNDGEASEVAESHLTDVEMQEMDAGHHDNPSQALSEVALALIGLQNHSSGVQNETPSEHDRDSAVLPNNETNATAATASKKPGHLRCDGTAPEAALPTSRKPVSAISIVSSTASTGVQRNKPVETRVKSSSTSAKKAKQNKVPESTAGDGVSSDDSQLESESDSASEGDERSGSETPSDDDSDIEEELAVIAIQFQLPTADGSTKSVSFLSNMAFKEFCTGVSAFLNIVPEGLLLTSKLNNSRKSPMRLDTVDDWKRLKEDYRTAAENAEVAYKKAREKWKAAGKTTARPKKKVVEIVIVHRGGEKSAGASASKGKKSNKEGNGNGTNAPMNRGGATGAQSDESDVEVTDSKSGRGRWIMKIKSQPCWKCEQHPGTVCYQRADGFHYQLTVQDLNLWANLIDQGKARIDRIPEELHVYEKTNERPVDPRKGKPGSQSSGLAAIEASTAALAQAVQLVTMSFGAGHGLTPPPTGSTVNTSNLASASVSTNTAQGGEAPQSPSIQRHLRETIIYPTIESWLARLEAADPDKHPWTQYTADLHANRYLRINQLADTRLMSSEKLMRLVGGLQEGAADYLLAMAMDECAELQAAARKAFLKA